MPPSFRFVIRNQIWLSELANLSVLSDVASGQILLRTDTRLVTTSCLKSLNTKKTTTYINENTVPGLEQAQKCGRVKQSQTSPSWSYLKLYFLDRILFKNILLRTLWLQLYKPYISVCVSQTKKHCLVVNHEIFDEHLTMINFVRISRLHLKSCLPFCNKFHIEF